MVVLGPLVANNYFPNPMLLNMVQIFDIATSSYVNPNELIKHSYETSVMTTGQRWSLLVSKFVYPLLVESFGENNLESGCYVGKVPTVVFITVGFNLGGWPQVVLSCLTSCIQLSSILALNYASSNKYLRIS